MDVILNARSRSDIESPLNDQHTGKSFISVQQVYRMQNLVGLPNIWKSPERELSRSGEK